VILRTFEDIKADIEINIREKKKDHFLIGICPSYKQTNYPQTQTHRGIPPATISLPPSLPPSLLWTAAMAISSPSPNQVGPENFGHFVFCS
jgi:hypothetical protein